MTTPKTIVITTNAWLSAYTIKQNPVITAALLSEHPEWIQYSNLDMATRDWVKIGSAKLEVTLPKDVFEVLNTSKINTLLKLTKELENSYAKILDEIDVLQK